MISKKDKIVRLLDALLPGVKVYLFGSRARGTHNERSDIDLALDCGRELSLQEVAEAKRVLESLNIPQKIDVVDMYSIPEAMKNNIERDKVVWKD